MSDKYGAMKKRPIAIIGIGCRFPGGGETPEEFWQMLLDKIDGVKPIPADRWDAEAFFHPDYHTKGKMQVKEGGFVDNIDQFDAQFFGIAPVEAKRMDPQQRMLLEHTYYAFEDAGLTLNQMAGSRTGVFVGISSTDYAGMQNSYEDRANIGAYTNTGGAASIAANRISYAFDLIGPSFAVDTACSSGLVATHIACQSIWNGDAEMAIVGGVNILLRPEVHIGFSTGGFLSPDCRCKTFDAAANGYVRSEGVGVVVLKPLDQAIADQDQIYATIIGSALNEDGRTGGISMPNPKAQIDVLQRAYQDAEIDPKSVDYVEAHGTGTAVGDPIECNSIATVLGGEKQLLIGSVKSNVGHLEAASGLAGMIKTALTLKHRQVPANIHFNNPNPEIDFAGLGVKIPTGTEVLRKTGKPLTAGINSFGFGGANAHVVMQSYSGKNVYKQAGSGPLPLFLSARSDTALKELAKSYIKLLKDPQVSLADLCYSVATRRSSLEIRAALPAMARKSTRKLLDDLAQGRENPLIAWGRKDENGSSKTAFVFSGQGPQWFAMGRELLKENKLFRDSISEVDKVLKKLGWLKQERSSLVKELQKSEKASRMHETEIAQPAIFAIQVALTRVWNSLGVVPDGIIGHSIGEVAASWGAGALSLEEATRIVYWRSRCQTPAAGKGKMLAVGLNVERAEAKLVKFERKIDIAGVNGPEMVTLAGETKALELLAEELETENIFNRFLVVDVPFHSFILDDIIDDFKKSIKNIKNKHQEIELYSTVTGKTIEGKQLNTAYWARNMRQSVLFYPAIEEMVHQDYETFVEISPHPILAHGLNAALKNAGKEGLVVGSLKRKEAEIPYLLSSLGQLFCHGVNIDLGKLFSGDFEFIKLPHYPWQRERYWLESSESLSQRMGTRVHPHLTGKTWNPKEPGTVVWDLELDHRTHPYIKDHRVQGPLVYPGAGHVDLALGVAKQSFGDDFGFLEDLEFMDPLFLPDEGEPYPAQISVTADEGDYVISSRRSKNVQDWTIHSKGRINHIGDSFCHHQVNLSQLRKRIKKPVKVGPLFEILENGGLLLGPAFKGLTELWRVEGESLGRIEIHENIRHDCGQYNIHPALLDASFQTAFGIISGTDYEGVFIPIKIKRVKFYKTQSSKIFSYAKAASYTDDVISADIWIMDEGGELLLEIQGFTAKYLKGSRGEVQGQLNDFFYAVDWLRKDRDDLLTQRKPGEFIPNPQALAKPLHAVINRIKRQGLFKQFTEEFSPAIEKIALSYMLEALLELGLEAKQTLFVQGLVKKLKISADHRHLFDRILEHLVKAKILKLSKGKIQIVREKLPDSGELMIRAEAEFGKFASELAMLKLCGPELARILNGSQDAIELLFAQENRQTLSEYYASAYTFDRYHQALTQAVKKLLAKIPEQRTLRVLEIGAGTGGITKTILPLFPPDRTEYFFTDISYEFMHQARKRFANYNFIEYRAFDITKGITKQDLLLGSYDLIIASNVIHSTPDVVKSLQAARNLLADGGTFLMLEVTHTSRYPDLVFGITEGWWNFLKDPWQRARCSLEPGEWEQALHQAGFAEVLAVTDIEEKNMDVPIQTVFLAKADLKNGYTAASEIAHGSWLLIPDQQGIGQKIADKLIKLGHEVHIVLATEVANFANPDPDELPLRGVIYTAGIDIPEFISLSDDNIKNNEKEYIFPLIEVAKDLEKNPLAASLDLWVITSESINVIEKDKLAVQQTPLIGLSRVISNEIRTFNTHLIDLSRKGNGVEIDQLIGEMTAPAGELSEEEIAFRGKKRLVRRLNRFSPKQRDETAKIQLPASGSAYHLEPGMDGVIEELKLRIAEIPVLQADEIAIEVKYSSLNFRDVMLATASLPDEALNGGLFGKHFGLECSGIVKKIGKAVKGFRVGDKVMVIARNCLAGKVHAKADFAVKIPREISLKEGAGLPMAYLTAYYSLVKIARLTKGEKVLIHAASGGVGIAAINIAQQTGAEIYTTASKGKHVFLRKCGIKHIYDSRSPGFYDRIMKDTKGVGVDVVLNSLSGPLLTQSLKVLAAGGRFVEIGKNDIYNNKRISLEFLADNSSYGVVDIDRLLIQKPALMHECLQEIFSSRSRIYLRNTQLIKHPIQVEEVANFAIALRAMAQGKHLGKVILAMVGEIMVNPPRDLALDAKGTYLVAGGTGGFGLAVGKFLAKKGAGHIVLASRSGKVRLSDKKLLEDIKNSGAKLSIVSVDVSRRSKVQKLIQKINTKAFPLKGIFQSTMVLADGFLEEMDWEQFAVPLDSKIQGTWNLHVATEKIKLDYFVSFSSIASLYGTPGQANYAAANSFLDSFAHFRRSKGLPATTINWGAIAEMGYVARNTETRDFLANHGWNPVSLANVLSGLEQAMLEGETQVGIFDVDWTAFAETFPHNATSGRFAHLHYDEDRQASGGEDSKGIADQLRLAAPGERADLANELLKSMMANILGMSKDKIDVQTQLTRMGIDSLMANQIRSWLTNQTGIPFSLMQIMQGPTLNEIATTVLESIDSEAGNLEQRANLSPWFLIPRSVESPRQRLFCFPYMGVGASVYNGWEKLVPEDVELVAIQLPGREERIGETPLFDTRVLFKQLGEEIMPLCDIPFSFYGHSFGGNIAMSFVTYLNGVHKIQPHHLFIGAAIPPAVANPLEADFELADKPANTPIDDKSLTALLRKLGTPESVLKDKKALQKIFLAVRGDLAMSRQRLISKDELLPCQITAIAGAKDDIYTPQMIRQWQVHSKDFRLTELPGSHLFIHEQASLQKLMEIINGAI